MADLILAHESPPALPPEQPSLTIEQAIAVWLDVKGKRSGSKKTLDAYRSTLASFRSVLRAAGLDLTSDPRAVMLAAQGWAGQGQGKGQRETVAPATYNRRLSILSSFYTFVSTRSYLPVGNPISLVEKRPVQAYAGVQTLNYAQLKQRLALINRGTLKGLRDYALLAIYVTTGRRLSEVASLTWSQVQLTDGRITLHFTRTKGGKVMHDQLADQVARALLAWLQGYYGTQLGVLAPATPLWVSLARNNTRGHPLTLQAIADLCEQHLGVRKVHLLRHTFARAMEDSGAKVSTIQERLGHSDLSTTGRYLAALHSAENPHSAAVAALLIGDEAA